MRITNFSFTKIDAFTLKNSLIKLEIAQTIHPAHPLLVIHPGGILPHVLKNIHL